MDKDKYNTLLQKNDYEALSNIMFLNDLVSFKYNNKFLIEHLLEKNIHSLKMDDYAKSHKLFAIYYLKYNIVKPLLSCNLNVLLSKYDDNNLILDMLLTKISEKEKLDLYNFLKADDYSVFHNREQEVIDVFLRHQIKLPTMFAITKNNKKSMDISLNKEDKLLIQEFCKTFKDHNQNILKFLTQEFAKMLTSNHQRAKEDIKKLIAYKKDKPSFILSDSMNTEGAYEEDSETLKFSQHIPQIFEHELSHLLYSKFDETDELTAYETLRKNLATKDNYEKIKKYIELFHMEYDDKIDYFEKEYYKMVEQKYGSFDKYLNVICEDMLKNKPEFISLRDIEDGGISFEMVDDSNISDIVLEFLIIEKNEYVIANTRKFYSSKLMLENLLDAIFMGKIFDDEKCLSGHGSLYYQDREEASFDECLANYDAIIKSSDNVEILEDLDYLLGNELIQFLNNYLKENRENSYGYR